MWDLQAADGFRGRQLLQQFRLSAFNCFSKSPTRVRSILHRKDFTLSQLFARLIFSCEWKCLAAHFRHFHLPAGILVRDFAREVHRTVQPICERYAATLDWSGSSVCSMGK